MHEHSNVNLNVESNVPSQQLIPVLVAATFIDNQEKKLTILNRVVPFAFVGHLGDDRVIENLGPRN